MRVDLSDKTVYPDTQDVISIHDDIVSGDPKAEPGTRKPGYISFSFEHIRGGPAESIHEQAVELLRMLAANHCFVDGNKRTALNTTWTFYFINGYYFSYGEEIKAVLQLFAVMEVMVDVPEVADYFEEIAYPIEEADEMDEEIQTLFAKSREATNLIEEMEEDLQVVESMEDIDEVSPKARETLGLIRDIRSIVFSEEFDDDDIFYEFVDEETQKLEGIIDHLQVLVNDFEDSNNGN